MSNTKNLKVDDEKMLVYNLAFSLRKCLKCGEF